jgi:hypothetical protein
MNNFLRRLVNLLAAVATIGFNGIANALPLNGQTTGEISDRFQVYFVPAGYVFAIWGLIYLGWIAYAVYQLLPAQRNNQRLQRIGYWFVLSCAANSAWLFLWHYEHFVLTVAAMLILLLALIVIYLRLQIGRVQVTPAERWCVDIPFSLYLGWITVATIANLTAVLSYLRWNGWGIHPAAWAVILIIAALCITTAMLFTRRDTAYALVILWALAGVAIKNQDAPSVAVCAWTATALVGLMVIVTALAKRRGSRQQVV